VKIKLYYMGSNDKPDIIIDVQDTQTLGILQILKGCQTLEQFEKWQNLDAFQTFYTECQYKAEVYVERIKRLKKLSRDNWDWDWAAD